MYKNVHSKDMNKTIIRDHKGQFITGHKCLTHRDKKTGRYIRFRDLPYKERQMEHYFNILNEKEQQITTTEKPQEQPKNEQ